MPRAFLAAFAFVVSLATSVAHAGTQITGARVHEAPDYTRAVFDTTAPARFTVFTLAGPDRVVVDLDNAQVAAGFSLTRVALEGTTVKTIRGGPRGTGYRIVLEVSRPVTPKGFTLVPVAQYGDRLVVDLFGTTKPIEVPEPGLPAPSGARDVLVVIDPGHGGEDPGAIGVGRIQEKNVVLAISREIVKELNATNGYRAELVRTGDYYVALRERTQIARKKRADMFVSVHADAFSSASVRGASVYTLSERGASSETARWLAEKENRSDLIGGVGDVSLDDKDDLLAHVILDLSMDGNRVAGVGAGDSVLKSVGRITALHKRTVEQAGFVVLKSPDVPSMLVETGYLSHPNEARELAKPAYQKRIAKAIAGGLTSYMSAHPPPGTLLANSRGAAQADASSALARGANARHVIVEGETLSGIAQRYRISTRSLRAANRLATDTVRVGQVLIIPAS